MEAIFVKVNVKGTRFLPVIDPDYLLMFDENGKEKIELPSQISNDMPKILMLGLWKYFTLYCPLFEDEAFKRRVIRGDIEEWILSIFHEDYQENRQKTPPGHQTEYSEILKATVPDWLELDVVIAALSC